MFPLALLNSGVQPTVQPTSSLLVLLEMEGTDDSIVFTDTSSYNRTVTRIGSIPPTITTADSFSGSSSARMIGWGETPTSGSSGLRVNINPSEIGLTTTRTFTIQGYVKINAATHDNAGVVVLTSGLSYPNVSLYYGGFRVANSDQTAWAADLAFTGALLSTTAFTKVKITSDGVDIKLYLDDVLILTTACPAWINVGSLATTAFGVAGADTTHTQGGWYDEWRLLNEVV